MESCRQFCCIVHSAWPCVKYMRASAWVCFLSDLSSRTLSRDSGTLTSCYEHAQTFVQHPFISEHARLYIEQADVSHAHTPICSTSQPQPIKLDRIISPILYYSLWRESRTFASSSSPRNSHSLLLAFCSKDLYGNISRSIQIFTFIS